ncbi:dehydrogenase [bacterium LRH843]|nr:dehydrogenase [bacterium LRH843]
MGKFKIGLTRDFLNPDGELNADIGLELLDGHPNIEYEFMDEFKTVITPDQIKDYDAVISLYPAYTKDSFKGVERLTAIARAGVGFDGVDLDACTEADIICFTAPKAVRRPMAVSILTFMLALGSKVFAKDKIVREGRWEDTTNHMGVGLKNKVVGSVGLGGIAQEFFQISKPLEYIGLAYDPFVSEEEANKLGVKLVDLETLLKESDFLSISVPSMDSTYHLIGERELSLMKPTAFLINTARGPIVDQQALTKCLQEKRIQGAALDVFETEPLDPKDPITTLDNVILAPHAIGFTDELFRGLGEEDINGILRIAQGLIPDSVVNKEVLHKDGLKSKLAHHRESNVVINN